MNDNKKWVCWNNGSKKSFYRYELLKYIQQGKGETEDIIRSSKKIYDIYYPRLNRYHTVIHKNIHKDLFVEEENNYVIINCLQFKNLIYNLTNIPDDLCEFAKKHNLKIFLLYIEHPLENDYVLEFDECFEKYCSFDTFKSKNIKVIINSFGGLNNSLYKDCFVCIDAYSYVMRTFFESSDIKVEYPILEDKKYDFSLLVGAFGDRFERVVLLNYLFENGMLDDRFFYTTICQNKKQTLDDIKGRLSEECNEYINQNNDLKKSIEKNINLFLEHRIYDKDGTRVKDFLNNAYENGMDYKIPLQVRQSCINILFETKIKTPSITEKMYKPIIAGVPFIWYGPVNCSEYLISKGYKLYPFIDYSFDFIEDKVERMKVLLKEIKRLKGFGFCELKKQALEYKNISIYNQETFIKNTETLDELYDKIRKCV